MKSIVALIIPLILTVLFESILSKIFIIIFEITYEYASTIPIYRIVFTLVIYAIIYITYRLCKKLNINVTILDDIEQKKQKNINFYVVTIYNYSMYATISNLFL